jgi:outer membrane immunogenic protein
MRRFKFRIAAVTVASLTLVNFGPISAKAENVDAVSARVQSLEAELAAVKKENDLLRQIRRVRDENTALKNRTIPTDTAQSAPKSDTAQAAPQRNAIDKFRSARAADMPARPYTKAPVMVDPGYNWTGFYIGGNVGGAFDRSNASIAPTSPTTCVVTLAGACLPNNAFANELPYLTNSTGFNQAAFTGGLQAGYNRQFGKYVVGVETDFNFTGGSNSSTINATGPLLTPAFFPETISHKLDWFGTVRGRLGVTPVDRLLLYATGGLAYGRVASSTSITFNTPGIFFPFAGSASTIGTGWTVGGGGEWAFADHWSAKLEYLYVDLGTMSYLSGNGNPTGRATPSFFQTDVTTREHIVRAGVNYKFDWGPVVAKY